MAAHYTDPACTLTLREALVQHLSEIEGAFDPADCSSPEVGEMFRCHDAVHVIFGTDTSLPQETLTDLWTLAATDLSWREGLSYYKAPETAALMQEVGAWRLLWGSLEALPSLPKLLWRASRMQHRWAWNQWSQHLDERLVDIRSELGLQILAA
ncbi:MAG: hypothetical protein H6740_26395 [Alphaproteobacteria bacterium]|nr:hypothetical protein [Alphaproteobacteria bacterium]